MDADLLCCLEKLRLDTDSDIAFDLQLQEALAASLLDGASPSPDVPDGAVLSSTLSNMLDTDNLSKFEQELLDQDVTAAETERLRLDLRRQIHDRAFACEIMNVPEEQWRHDGDNLNRPYGEGSSSSSTNGQGSGFRVYIKGLVEGPLGGLGVAICDENDGLVFELTKGFNGNDRQANKLFAPYKAFIEGLDAAVMLDLKGVTIVTDNSELYEFITAENQPIPDDLAALVNQKSLLLRNRAHTLASLADSNDIKFADELARKAIASGRNSYAKNLSERCTICLEDTYVDQMFLITSCRHSYCFSCMLKHVQFKLLQGILPQCPYEKCVSELNLESCRKFLSPELFDIMSQRLKEASVPPAERVYCPYPQCSIVSSKTELQGSMGNSNAIIEILGCRKCPKCSGNFCINCKVPWHSNMNCSDFKRNYPNQFKEEQSEELSYSESLASVSKMQPYGITCGRMLPHLLQMRT